MVQEQIEKAVADFRTLLTEQLARTVEMEKALPPKDYKTAAKIRVGMIDGDGIGPIIMREARRDV